MRPPHATTRTDESGAISARCKPIGALAPPPAWAATTPIESCRRAICVPGGGARRERSLLRDRRERSGDAGRDAEGRRRHPLPDGNIGQHGIYEVRGLGRAPLRGARRAHRPRLATERHEALIGAVWAAGAKEAPAQVAAAEVGAGRAWAGPCRCSIVPQRRCSRARGPRRNMRRRVDRADGRWGPRGPPGAKYVPPPRHGAQATPSGDASEIRTGVRVKCGRGLADQPLAPSTSVNRIA